MSYKNSKKQTKLKLTQPIMAKSLLEVRDVLEININFLNMLLDEEIEKNNLEEACKQALEIDVFKAMLEMLTSGNLIVNINGEEYPLIYLYNVVPTGVKKNEA